MCDTQKRTVVALIFFYLYVSGLIYPNVISLEQCSSELTARYKASLMQGDYLIDVTGGFGVDTYFLAQNFKRADYFEQNDELFKVVQNNFHKLNTTHIQCYQGDGIALLKNTTEKADWIYIDPARRTAENAKTFLIEDCTPDIITINELLLEKAENILIKLSPMLDLEQVLTKLKGVQKIIIVSVKNECKELLVQLSAAPIEETHIPVVCVNILDAHTQELFESNIQKRKNEHVDIRLSAPLNFIYEPNKSILKGRVQDHLAESLGAYKLDINSNFFTSEALIEDYQGRVFKKIAIIKAKKKLISRYLDKGKANIIARNFPMKASQIYDKFKITPGGTTYLIATKLSDQSNVIIVCERLR